MLARDWGSYANPDGGELRKPLILYNRSHMVKVDKARRSHRRELGSNPSVGVKWLRSRGTEADFINP